mgnify:CR=1 FL=1
MSKTFRLPDLGEGIGEAEILAVHVTVGQIISEGDLLLEVETDKAAVEIPSPISGTVQEIRVRKGDMAKVGAILISFADSAAAGATVQPAPAAEPTVGKEPGTVPAQQIDAAGHPATVPGSPVPASPATRRLARELGVDLRALTPSGAGGVVTKDDVLAFAEGTGKAEAPPAADDRYFYFEHVTAHDWLFVGVAEVLLGRKPSRSEKAGTLTRLREMGVFLIDLKLDPADGSSLAKHVPDLVSRCRILKPERIILVKATVFDAAYGPLRAAGLPVIDHRVYFPSTGRQARFREPWPGPPAR